MTEHLDVHQLDAWWNFDDPHASAARFRAALDGRPPKSMPALELRTQLARALALTGDVPAAQAELAVVTAAGISDPVLAARLALEHGRLLRSSGRPGDAIPHFDAARQAAVIAGDEFLLVDALHMLALVEPDRAQDWTTQALAVADAAGDDRTRRWSGSLHNNLGWHRHDAGDFADAHEHFELALDSYRRFGSAEDVRVARWATARALRSLGRWDEALIIQRDLATGPADGYVDEELAELLLARGTPEQARPHFARAAQLLGADEWLAEHEPGRLQRLRVMGRTPA